MVQALESELKQIVLASGRLRTPGNQRLAGAIAEDFSQYGPSAMPWLKLEVIPDRSPATAVRLGGAISCWAGTTRHHGPEVGRWRRFWPTSIWQGPVRPWAITPPPE